MLAIGYKVGAVVLLIAVVVAAYVGYSERQLSSLAEVLEAEVATYERVRWDRPVLRGAATDGNAAEHALQLVEQLPLLAPEQRKALAEHVHAVRPLPEDLKALISAHRVTLTKIRAATNYGFASTVLKVERGRALRGPDYPRIMDAALMMLAAGLSYDAPSCLELAADVIRFGQDLVPGAWLEAASVSMRITSVSVPLLTSCAARAEVESLRRAASELHVLATHPPPVGVGIELADLAARVELLRGAALDAGEGLFAQLRARPSLHAKWSALDKPTRFRELRPQEYPKALEAWKREHDHRVRNGMAESSELSAGVLGFLYDDMRGQALLRALSVGAATLAETKRRGSPPREPVNLREVALRDPFNGRPLSWRLAQTGEDLTLWSVGEDLRDDKGSPDWAAQAPIDVVVRFALRAPAPVTAAARPSRRAR